MISDIVSCDYIVLALGKKKILCSLNVRTRIFGILFLQNNRDTLNTILDKRTNNRAVLDDPVYRKGSLFTNITNQVNNPSIILSHPNGWETLVDKKNRQNVRKLELDRWNNINPNMTSNLPLDLTTNEVRNTFLNTQRLYKHAMRKWTKGTGGGSGDPENYCNWDERSEDNFAR